VRRHTDQQQGCLRTYYDSGGAIIDRFGSVQESKGNSFDTVQFGLRIVGYF
jgi:hypothetical protein